MRIADMCCRRLNWNELNPMRGGRPGLTFRLPADMLPVAYSRIWPEPPAANRRRSLPGLCHGDASWSPRVGASAGLQFKLSGSVLESGGGQLFARQRSKQAKTPLRWVNCGFCIGFNAVGAA